MVFTTLEKRASVAIRNAAGGGAGGGASCETGLEKFSLSTCEVVSEIEQAAPTESRHSTDSIAYFFCPIPSHLLPIDAELMAPHMLISPRLSSGWSPPLSSEVYAPLEVVTSILTVYCNPMHSVTTAQGI